MKRILSVILVLGASPLFLLAQAATGGAAFQKHNGKTAAIEAVYANLPLGFERNHGQAAAQARFISRAPYANILLTDDGLIIALLHGDQSRTQRAFPGDPSSRRDVSSDTFQVKLIGGNSAPSVTALDALPGTSNYFRGNDPRKWLTKVPTYGRVRFADVYPGIHMIYYGKNRQLEYDFVVMPETDPGVIRFRLEGAQHVAVTAEGDLLLELASGTALLKRPYAYQEEGEGREPVASRYALEPGGEVHFALGSYDRSRTLIIDPAVDYSTFLGGSFNNAALGLAVDTAGNAYVAGFTTSPDFPVTPGAFQTTCQANCSLDGDAFVTKLDASGNIVYSTFLGGSISDEATAIAIDSAGNAYVTGETFSPDFPVTPSAFQSTPGGDFDMFVSKLDPTGSSLLYSTYLGGTGSDLGTTIAADNSGNAFIGGHSSVILQPNNFPTTAGAFKTSTTAFTTGIVARIDTGASGAASLVYSTYLGGSGLDEVFDLALDSSDNAYVTGETESLDFPVTAHAFQKHCNPSTACSDAFVTKLNPQGSALIYSTYLGGSSTDDGNGIAVDAAGHAYVVGDTSSKDFPLKNPFQKVNHGGANQEDAFFTELNLSGSRLEHSTYLGGNGDDVAFGVAVDSRGNGYVTGITASTNFPLKKPLQNMATRSFVTRFNEAGNKLVFSTYLGDNNTGFFPFRIRADATSHAYVAGQAFTSATNAGFVTKICILVCP